jgi:hypothetical protein
VFSKKPSPRVLLPELRRLPGFSGAYLLARDDDGLVELTAHTLWASLDAIRASQATTSRPPWSSPRPWQCSNTATLQSYTATFYSMFNP